MIAGDRTQRNVKKSSTPARTPSGHSRESGNPFGAGKKANLEIQTFCAQAHAPMDSRCSLPSNALVGGGNDRVALG